jgi:CRP-like cAMP-binding protein
MSSFGLKADADLQKKLVECASQVLPRMANEQLFHEGDKSHGLFLIKKGRLRLSLNASPGKMLIERVIGRGHIVGLPATVNGYPYSLNCDVVEDAELAYISRQDLTKLMKTDTTIAIKLLDLLSLEVQAMRIELANVAPLSSRRSGSPN